MLVIKNADGKYFNGFNGFLPGSRYKMKPIWTVPEDNVVQAILFNNVEAARVSASQLIEPHTIVPLRGHPI